MSVILEVNYSKKLGLPNYSSHSHSVTLRVELSDLSQLEKTNAELYARLQTAVDSQIVNAGHLPVETAPASRQSAPTTSAPAASSPAHRPAPAAGGDVWQCSPKQRELIEKIVRESQLDIANIEMLAHLPFLALVACLTAGVAWWLWPVAPVPEKTPVVKVPTPLEVTANSPDRSPLEEPASVEEPIPPDHSDARQLADRMEQNMMANIYADLFQQLNLPPQQNDALSRLLSQRFRAASEAILNAMTQGNGSAINVDLVRQQASELQAQIDQNIHSLLGDAGFQQYQEFSATLPQPFRGSPVGGQWLLAPQAALIAPE